MEKEVCNNPAHDQNCHWCGLGKGFSWKRLILAILLGLFIFMAGIQIGEMRGSYGQYGSVRMMGMQQRWTRDGLMMHGDDNIDLQRYGTTTIVVPAEPATPGTATTAPAPVRQ